MLFYSKLFLYFVMEIKTNLLNNNIDTRIKQQNKAFSYNFKIDD